MTASKHPTARMRAVFAGLLSFALFWAACGRSTPSMTVDRVHDLAARIDEAEFEGGSAYPLPSLLGVEADDNRDGMFYLRAKPGASITFRHLYTRGRAVLRFGCGVAFRHGKIQEDRAVAFRVEAGKEGPPGRGPSEMAFTTLFDRAFRPSDFPEGTRFLPFEYELPGRGEAEWTLRFSCRFPDGGSAPAAWPGWIAPRLISEGRRIPLRTRPVERTNLVKDLVSAFDRKKVMGENPAEPVGVGTMDAAERVVVHGGRRKTLLAAAPSRIRYRLRLDAESILSFSFGMDTKKGWSLPGDGMTFSVEVDGETAWSRDLDPHRNPADRGWKSAVVDLDRWSGRTVALDLVTGNRGDSAHDVGGWSRLRLLRRRRVPRRPAGEAPTVIVVVVEAFRTDRLGVYGGRPGMTPRLDAMARKGILFTRAHAVSSWTWPSVGSILTGLDPTFHGVQDYRRCYLVDAADTLAELFADRGYTTAAFVTNLLISKDNNFQQGFESFYYLPYLTARALNERFLNWLDDTEGTARFAYLHFFDPHAPYAPPAAAGAPGGAAPSRPEDADLLSRVKAAGAEALMDPGKAVRILKELLAGYDGEVAYFDTAFGELLDAMRKRGVLENCLIVFTADHGEEFLDHNRLYHGPQLYEETLHVPLWITGYGKAGLPPRTVSDPVSTRDLLPTLCALAGVEPPSSPLLGTSMLDVPPEDLFSQTLIGVEKGVEGRTEKAAVIHRGRWKLIYTPATKRVELYDLEEDPGEGRDRAAAEPDLRAALLRVLQAWRSAAARAAPEGIAPDEEEMKARLRALGYIGK